MKWRPVLASDIQRVGLGIRICAAEKSNFSLILQVKSAEAPAAGLASTPLCLVLTQGHPVLGKG